MRILLSLVWLISSQWVFGQSIEELLLDGNYLKAQQTLETQLNTLVSGDLTAADNLERSQEIADQFILANNRKRGYEIDKYLFYTLHENKIRRGREYEAQLNRLALASLEIGNYVLAGRSLESLSEHLLVEYGRNSSEYAENMAHQAYYYALMGDLSSAEGLVSESYEIITDLDPISKESFVIISRLAQILSLNGKPAKSENYFYQAEKIAKEIEIALGDRLRNLREYALLEIKLKNFRKGLDILEAAEMLAQENNLSQQQISRIHSILFRLYTQAKSKQRADSVIYRLTPYGEEYYPHSMELIQHRIDLIEHAILVGQLNEAKDIADTLEKDWLANFGDQHYFYGKILHLKSKVLYHEGKYEQALPLEKEALEISSRYLDFEHPNRLESLSQLSLLYWANGDLKQAKKWFLKSLFYYNRRFESNFAFLSEDEKSLFYEEIKSFYDKFNAFVVENGRNDSDLYSVMLNNQLASKGLLFSTTQKMREQINSTPKYRSLYEEWLIARERLTKVKKVSSSSILEQYGLDLDSMSNKVNDLEKELSLRTQLGSVDIEAGITDWYDIRYALDSKEGALEMVRVPGFSPEQGGNIDEKNTKYLGLFISKGTRKVPEAIFIENGYNLENRFIRFYRNAIKYRLTDTVSYKNFWKPLAENRRFSGVEKVYFSSDGVYNQISLNSLLDAEQGEYLMDETDVISVGNLSDILDIKTRERKKGEGYLLMGYPDYNVEPSITNVNVDTKILDEQTLKKSQSRDINSLFVTGTGVGIPLLPGTKEEVEKIDKLLVENNKVSTVFLGEQASEENLKRINNSEKSPYVLHIATHGFFIPPKESKTGVINNISDPLENSGLLFARASYGYDPEITLYELDQMQEGFDFQDGILTAYEAMNLNLNATDLVILSACETGLGEIKAGEGVYGLQRSMQTAGAKSVIMSLWVVDDQATNQFMQFFYEYLLAGENKREAFNHAVTELRKQYNHPFYWGAFVMVGS